MALQRLLPDRLAPDAGDDDRQRRLSLAKARQAERRRQVRGGVLECVLEIRFWDLDVQPDSAFRKLFDLRFL